MINKFFCEAIHSHSHLILDPGSACYDDAGGGFAPSSVTGVCRSRIQDQVAVAVAVAGLTKRFFNHIQKDFLINVWGYWKFGGGVPEIRRGTGSSAVQNFQGIHST